MKIQRSEIVFLILSIIVLIFAAGTYFIYGKTSTIQTTSTNQSQTAAVNSDVEIATAALSNLESSLTDESLSAAEDAISAVSDESQKAQLTERLETARSKVFAINNAEENLTTFEQTRYYENADAAYQAIIDLDDSERTDDLIQRYNTVASELGLIQIESTSETN